MNRKLLCLLLTLLVFGFGSGFVSAAPSASLAEPLRQQLRDHPWMMRALPESASLERAVAVSPESSWDVVQGAQKLLVQHRFSALRDEASNTEFLFLGEPSDVGSIRFDIRELSGFAEVVNEGRAVRFISNGSGPDLRLDAPDVVDSSGRPSLAGRWIILRDGSNQPIAIRLSLGDRHIRYPAVAASRLGKTTKSSTALRPQVNATGSISGTVRNTSGTAIAGAAVFVFNSAGSLVAFGASETTGTYSFGELDTDSYRVVATADGYTGQLYNNIPCPDMTCNIPNGTAVNVVDGANTPSINFSLTGNGTAITGHIQDSQGNPLTGVIVVAYDAASVPAGSGVVDDSGNYRIDLSVGGTFRLRTFNSTYPGFSEQVYSGINCSACNVGGGTAVSTPTGTTHSNVDFVLSSNGGRIAGLVTDNAHVPLVERGITIFSSTGTAVSYAITDNNGGYISFHGLVPGTYYVLASAFGYTPEVYDNVPCVSCSVTSGNPVNVVAATTTANIDFALSSAQAKVTGRVLDATTGLGIDGATVVFYDSNGRKVHSATTEGNAGIYEAVLPASGRYYAQTRNDRAMQYVDQLYSRTDCSGCPVTQGTPIDVVVGTLQSGIDFFLARDGGSISGRILDASYGTPIPFAFVLIYGPSGNFATEGFADANGNYTLDDGLTAGTFFVLARAFGYTAEIYNNVACPTDCDPTAGRAVVVTRGSTTGSIDFSLSSTSAKISGHVRSTTADLPGVDVFVYDSTGALASTATSDSSGLYEAVVTTGGTFFAVTRNTAFPQFGDQLYNHIACNGCDPQTGSPIVLAAGDHASNINFDFGIACPAIFIDPSGLPDGNVGDPYNFALTATGGAAPFTFAVTKGILPAGVTLSSAGVLSGTLASSGIYQFTITATDANGCTGSVIYNVEVTAVTTTLTLTASPTTAFYGQPITLTATISPSSATGTVTFVDGVVPFTTAPLVSGSATRIVSALTPGVHHLSAAYPGSGGFSPSTSPVVDITIEKATPVITWNDPAAITYGTPLSSLQLNATTTVPGTFTYTPPAGTILDAGMQTLATTFIPSDPSLYNTAMKSVTLEVRKADQQINWSNPADIVYGTPLGPTQLNATVTVPGPSPAGTLTYDPAAGTILAAGTHTLSVTAAATANYNQAQKSVTLNVVKATPVFSSLSAPTIIVGTPVTMIQGVLTAGSLVPPGVVTVTLNGVSQDVPIDSNGAFSASFATSALMPVLSGYPIQFSYAGSANFAPATATTVLTVTYGVTGGPLQSNPANSGSTIPIRIQIVDVNGFNLSSRSVAVVAYGVRLVTDTTWTPVQSTGNASNEFTFAFANRGSYSFNLKTTGLASGSYVLGIQVRDDPVIHTVTFEIR